MELWSMDERSRMAAYSIGPGRMVVFRNSVHPWLFYFAEKGLAISQGLSPFWSVYPAMRDDPFDGGSYFLVACLSIGRCHKVADRNCIVVHGSCFNSGHTASIENAVTRSA